MIKIIEWIKNNIFFVFTFFLLAFIPLYPKLPIVNINHTWVYIRGEDFVVVIAIFSYLYLLLLKKVTLKTPLTLPIMIFWIVGGIATLHGVLLVFPTLSDVFSNVALLSYLRRIEYLSLFFVAFLGMRDRKFINYIGLLLPTVLILITIYGVGQRYLGFPAFLTMNEEFAKGIPIQLSRLSRVPSTFGGHYDLAAYLVLVIPLVSSLIFGFKSRVMKIFLLFAAFSGFGLLFMTVSRVSFFVLLLSLVLLLFLYKKKWVIFTLLILTIGFLSFSPKLLQRFGSTVTEVNVLVDAKTGRAISQIKEVSSSYFNDKIVIRDLTPKEAAIATTSAIITPRNLLPEKAIIAVEPNRSTGENLPQGTGYINLSLSPIVDKPNQYFYERPALGTKSAEVRQVYGEFLVKRALAYDLSFTTRFQGEWPRTIKAFTRNIFLGSGYASVSLAVDNDYLRILGETGLFGLIAFVSIFITAGIYIKKILPNVDSPLTKSYVIGFMVGTFGLVLNAALIDVFEASKVAFTYWLLMGITIGVLHLYKKEEIDLYKSFRKVIFSPFAVILYLLVFTASLFSSLPNYYFVGDDFTWFRWVSSYKNNSILATIIDYFISADGFFYRPGTKLYFLVMNSIFWLNQNMYHMVSIFLHFCVAALVFLISRRVLKSYFLSILSAVIFVVLSGPSEAVFWISSTGFLFTSLFVLLSLFSYILWKEKREKIYMVVSLTSIVLGLLFHELGVVGPLIIILYDFVFVENFSLNGFRKKYYIKFLFPLLPYLILRLVAKSHWLSGDYNYNILKLPFNLVGNIIGYLTLTVFGSASLSVYQSFRNFFKIHYLLAIIIFIILFLVVRTIYKKLFKKMIIEEKKIVIFCLLFSVVSLLPFLGLGNITSRYSYLASAGLVMLFPLFLKKIYIYLLNNGRDIALGSVVLIAIIFLSNQLFQLQGNSRDWKVAGEKSEAFLNSLNSVYTPEFSRDPMQFYFVNVPIRNGDAWIFPVGLKDAVWFVFRNDQIIVNQVPTLDDAARLVEEGSINKKIYLFESSGGVLEVERTKKGVFIHAK